MKNSIFITTLFLSAVYMIYVFSIPVVHAARGHQLKEDKAYGMSEDRIKALAEKVQSESKSGKNAPPPNVEVEKSETYKKVREMTEAAAKEKGQSSGSGAASGSTAGVKAPAGGKSGSKDAPKNANGTAPAKREVAAPGSDGTMYSGGGLAVVPSSGVPREQITLDGSGLQKEVEFPGKK